MRIAVWHNLPSGGGKRALFYHVRGLVERGHHVESWCPPTADQSYLPLSQLVTEHVVPLSGKSGPTSKGWLYPYLDMAAKLHAIDDHCQRCAEEMTEGRFTVLLANSCMFLGTSPIARHARMPAVLYLQEPNRMLYEAHPALPWLAIPDPRRVWWSPRYLRWFLRDLARVQPLRLQAREELRSASAYDRILVNSYFSRESVLRAYGIDATVCYLGIDTEMFRPTGQQREDFVLSVGMLVSSKNVGFILRAVASVPEPRPPIIWVANTYSDAYLAEMMDLARSLGVDFRPKIRVSDTELVELYNTASVMLYAPRLEPFGFAPLEASACGLPVVAVAEGGIRETVIDGLNGLLVAHSPEVFGKAVQRLISDRCYAQDLGAAGRQFVEGNWSLDACIGRLEQQINETIA